MLASTSTSATNNNANVAVSYKPDHGHSVGNTGSVGLAAHPKANRQVSNKSDRVWMSDMKPVTEHDYSVDTMPEKTPLSNTGAFVYEGPYGGQEPPEEDIGDGGSRSQRAIDAAQY